MAAIGVKERLFRRYLLWRARPRRLRRSLAAEVAGFEAPERTDIRTGDEESVYTVAAVQLQAKLFADPVEYASEMHRAVAEAINAGARLIVFPEYNNLQLLGMLPGVESVAEGVLGGRDAVHEPPAGGDESDDESSARPTDVEIRDVFRYIGPIVKRTVYTTFAWLAARYRSYIVAGSFLLPEGERLINRSLLFAPDGALVGFQDKVHLMPIEHALGIDAGTGFSVFDTDLGRMGIPVCMDATFSETFRILELQGARIAALPIADAADYNYWLALRGIVPRVQESQIYGIKSALVGPILGVQFTGKSGIFAPAALTPAGDGMLAEAADAEEAGVVTAEVDLAALERVRETYEHRDFNLSLYARYFPHVYERRPARGTCGALLSRASAERKEE